MAGDCGQRAQVETAKCRCKAIIDPCLRGRSFTGQQDEAVAGVAVHNRMLHT